MKRTAIAIIALTFFATGISDATAQRVVDARQESAGPADRPGQRGPEDRGPQERGRRGPGGQGQRGQGQRGQGQPGEFGGRFAMPPHPLMEAIDTNGDGELSADEIANASKALSKLDRNDDGKLTEDELRPEGGPQMRGRGGQFGEGPKGRGRGPDAQGEQGRRGPGGRGPDQGSPDGRGGERPRRPNAQQPGDSGAFVQRLLDFDENQDGKVSAEELPERMQRIVENGDTNDDGVLDQEELNNLAGAQAGPGQQPPGERRRRPQEQDK